MPTAVLESGAFGEHQPVTLQEALQQPDNINPLDKGEVVHHNTAPQPLNAAASGDDSASQFERKIWAMCCVCLHYKHIYAHNAASWCLAEEAYKSSGGADNSTLGRSSATVPDLQSKVTAWVERELMPAINRQVFCERSSSQRNWPVKQERGIDH